MLMPEYTTLQVTPCPRCGRPMTCKCHDVNGVLVCEPCFDVLKRRKKKAPKQQKGEGDEEGSEG